MLEGSPARLELAKALCDLGAAERDAGMLRRALNLALGGGAEPVAARAGAALAALGAAPAPPDDDVLTWAERRALTLARDGAGEREIAEALFLAPFEVARHLASARAKLGDLIRSSAPLRGLIDTLRRPPRPTCRSCPVVGPRARQRGGDAARSPARARASAAAT